MTMQRNGHILEILNTTNLQIGDIVQLSFNNISYSHSLIVVQNGTNIYNTLIAAHTYDVFGKSIAEYGFEGYRCLHIWN